MYRFVCCVFYSKDCFVISATAPKSLKSPWTADDEANQTANKQEEPWPSLGDRSMVGMVDQLFVHLLKAINICAHVIDDVPPGPIVKVLFMMSTSSGVWYFLMFDKCVH